MDVTNTVTDDFPINVLVCESGVTSSTIIESNGLPSLFTAMNNPVSHHITLHSQSVSI